MGDDGLAITFADLRKCIELAAREQGQIVEQTGQGGRQDVGIRSLQLEALGKRPRKKPRRVNLLDLPQNSLGGRRGTPGRMRDCLDRPVQPPRCFQRLDEMLGDGSFRFGGQDKADLAAHMLMKAAR